MPEYVTRVEFNELEGVVIKVKETVDELAVDKRVRDKVASERLSRKQQIVVYVSTVIAMLSLISGIIFAVVAQ